MLTNLVRENRSTLQVLIDKNGEMHIRAPKRMPLNEIVAFVNKKEQWITKKQTAIKEVLKINEPILSYKKVLYLGNCHNIVFVNYLKGIKIEDRKLLIPDRFEEEKIKHIKNFLKIAALNVIENRVLYLSKTFNLNFSALNLINSKNRWGVCSEQKEIGFNWRVIMLPPRVIDYVILHELAHLAEFNHSTKFWHALSKMMPDYKNQKELIRNCDYILQLFR